MTALGPYAVGCSNVEQDFTRIPPGESAQAYWEGLPRNGTGRFVTDLLVDPARSLVYQQVIPNDSGIFGSFAGRTMPYVLVVCYPTDPSNARADYVLPTGNVIPRMQRGGEAPLVLGNAAWPAVLYSHGLGGSPISGDYIKSLAQVASYGYVDDRRVPRRPALRQPRSRGLRRLPVRVAPLSRLHRDAGGAPAVAVLGDRRRARPSRLEQTYRRREHRRIRREPRRRVAAAAGGREAHDVARPFVDAHRRRTRGSRRRSATSRTSASTSIPRSAATSRVSTASRCRTSPSAAPPIRRRRSARSSEACVGWPARASSWRSRTRARLRRALRERHLDTWSFTFLGGQIADDPSLRATSARMTSVAGGMDDVQRIDYMAPTPPPAASRPKRSSSSITTRRSTITSSPPSRRKPRCSTPGCWCRAGGAPAIAFKAYARRARSSGLIACRFFGTPPLGPEFALLHHRRSGMREGEGESALDVRGTSRSTRIRCRRRIARRTAFRSSACTTTAWAARPTTATPRAEARRAK